mgnify:CR=1 FL=1
MAKTFWILLLIHGAQYLQVYMWIIKKKTLMQIRLQDIILLILDDATIPIHLHVQICRRQLREWELWIGWWLHDWLIIRIHLMTYDGWWEFIVFTHRIYTFCFLYMSIFLSSTIHTALDKEKVIHISDCWISQCTHASFPSSPIDE